MTHISEAPAKTDSFKRVKIDRATRDLYEQRNESQHNANPDAPVLPPDMWDNAIIGKYYRPKKTPVTVRMECWKS